MLVNICSSSFAFDWRGIFRLATIRLGILALLIFYLFAPYAVSDVSGHGDSTLIYQGPAGPYRLSLRILPAPPRVGTVHFTVSGLDSNLRSLESDPRIMIVAINSSGEPVYQSPAIRDPADPAIYEGNIIFRDVGAWSISVTVYTEENGEGSVIVPMQISAPAIEPGREGTIVFALITLALFGGTAYLWYASRKALAASRASP